MIRFIALMLPYFVFLFTLESNFAFAITSKLTKTAKIISIVNHEVLLAESETAQFQIGEMVAIYSQSDVNGVVGFLTVSDFETSPSGSTIYHFRVSRLSGRDLIQIGDEVQSIDLRSAQDGYLGLTELLVREATQAIRVSSRYRLLPTMGLTLGETADTLVAKEFYFNYYGLAYFGLTDRLTLGALVPVVIKGNPNLSVKYKLLDMPTHILSVGTTIARIEEEKRSTMNLNFLWDSIGSETLISHVLLTMSVENSTKDGSSIAIKSLGSSSIQNTYEILLKNWDRVFIGPSYNFEKKAVGATFTYMFVWDVYHLEVGLGSSNLGEPRFDPNTGYYAFFDMFWRL